MNRTRALSKSKAKVIIKSKTIWPDDATINGLGFNEFRFIIKSINEKSALFDDLSIMEASLNEDIDWDTLKMFIEDIIDKNNDIESNQNDH